LPNEPKSESARETFNLDRLLVDSHINVRRRRLRSIRQMVRYRQRWGRDELWLCVRRTMPSEHQWCRWSLRTPAGRSGQPIPGGQGSSAQNRLKRRPRQIDGVRNRLLQNQLLAQCEEKVPAEMVRLLQGARLGHDTLIVTCCESCDGGKSAGNKRKRKCRLPRETRTRTQ